MRRRDLSDKKTLVTNDWIKVSTGAKVRAIFHGPLLKLLAIMAIALIPLALVGWAQVALCHMDAPDKSVFECLRRK